MVMLETRGWVAELVLPDVSKGRNAFETSRNNKPVTQHNILKLIAAQLVKTFPALRCTETSIAVFSSQIIKFLVM
jgi:hypothetical protein